MTRQIRFLISVLLFVGLTCGSVVVAQKKKPRIKYYQVRANETFHVRLGQTLNSGKARVGDTFTTTVVDPVYSTNGIELVPSGSIISGRVTAVEKARKDGNPGTLSVVFYNLKLPNNRAAAMSGSLTDLNSGNTSSDNEGTATAKKSSHRNVKFIGGGAGGGALLARLQVAARALRLARESVLEWASSRRS